MKEDEFVTLTCKFLCLRKSNRYINIIFVEIVNQLTGFDDVSGFEGKCRTWNRHVILLYI